MAFYKYKFEFLNTNCETILLINTHTNTHRHTHALSHTHTCMHLCMDEYSFINKNRQGIRWKRGMLTNSLLSIKGRTCN